MKYFNRDGIQMIKSVFLGLVLSSFFGFGCASSSGRDSASSEQKPLSARSIASESSTPSMKTVVYKKVGALDLHASVYPVAGAGPKAAILYLHGGGLVSDGLGYFEKWGQLHLKRFHDAGYVVVNIEYRLAPQTKLPEIFNDVKSAYAWMGNEGVSEFDIDPTRIAIVGHSAGAYLAALSGARLSPRPAAVVIASGYSDINGDWYAKPSIEYLKKDVVLKSDAMASLGIRTGEVATTDSKTSDAIFGDKGYWVYLRQNGLWPLEVAGHDPADKKWYRQWNPIELVKRDYPPAFLLHGGKDTDVPFEQAKKMHEALQAKGVPSIYSFEKEGVHCFDALGVDEVVPDYVPPRLKEMDEFLSTYIGKKTL